MRKTFIFLLLFFVLFSAFGQKHTISGYIKDVDTGEELIGAVIYLKESDKGISSNIYGFYSLTADKGDYTAVVSYMGYATKEQRVSLDNDKSLIFNLQKVDNEIEEVRISGERLDKNVTSANMSVIKMPMDKIKKIPSLMGEVDIIKSIQLLPGVQSSGEGSSGFHVRGGGVDQNLVLLDDATVYNSSHLFGFFSVFNQDAVKDVKIFKGGIPAMYGGRLSSLLDIRMKEGNMKQFQASGGIGLISSRLTMEGPIIKDKASFLLSGRRTYFDLFFPIFEKNNPALKDAKVFFYDLNGKINYKINDNNRIFLSAYWGDDVMRFSEDFQTTYGNKTFTARYNHLFSPKLFSNITLIYSNFDYGLGIPEGAQAFNWISHVIDLSIKNDYTWYINSDNILVFGAGITQHEFQPGDITALDESFFNDFEMPGNFALDYQAFVDYRLNISEIISIRGGLRLSAFSNYGKSTFYEYDKSDPQEYIVTDTLEYDNGIINTYSGLEPRINIRVKINDKNSVKANYNRTMQYMHLATNTNAPTPYDFWFPSSMNIKPQKADQVVIGYFRNFMDNAFETSVEVYYKKMYNVIDFKDHAQIYLNRFLEGEVRAGNAYAYGAEFLIRKQRGKLQGWIGYTYSKSRRKIPEINEGREYFAPYDHPHDISVVLSYDFTKQLNISANWVYSTGAPRTFPTGRHEYNGMIVPVYSDRNTVRLPDYHRADISLTYNFKDLNRKGVKKRFQSSLNFSVYNLYNRHNVYSVSFPAEEDNPNELYAQKTYLFPVFPTVTYNFKFL
jgi:hypothetical protein